MIKRLNLTHHYKIICWSQCYLVNICYKKSEYEQCIEKNTLFFFAYKKEENNVGNYRPDTGNRDSWRLPTISNIMPSIINCFTLFTQNHINQDKTTT